MRPLLIALFGAIITVPAIAIFTNGLLAAGLWLASVFMTVNFADVFLAAHWWANGIAIIGAIPVFRHIMLAERQLAI